MILAAAGVAASLGYLVILRQREIALRIAIGADPKRVVGAVMLDALRPGALGAGLGLLATWLVPLLPVVKNFLHETPGFVPAFVAGGIAFAAAAFAGWFPARRAASIDPMLMLKAD
jgi:putative ABC transport system permease protein